ncbi:CoA transferase [Bradyrhizobium genosp. SA-3]|uniref:CaiB/BaiF CoA transferase family protein n=1 Tax=Bradyrhizobium genosp. SA-3 TaxID=508868 RepID=UPI001029CF0D|nr:CoA transferase [Bradyrhizobium genosp. SA-3]RZM96713.1 CoA transferase [Bradyrhizobium genosp. SA-3]
MTLPLVGLKVIDLTSVAFGPFASQILGEQGAEIIKVEPPSGDITRSMGPARHTGMSAMFLAFNRNKKSICLNLKKHEDRQALHELLKGADAIMHSIRPQKLQKIGLDYQTIRAIRPDIVYARLQGFGSGGPYDGRPAYDDIIQGMAGIPDLMDRANGIVRFLPTILADKLCGVYAAQAITSALVAKLMHGRGTEVEIPMLEIMVSFMVAEHWYGRHFAPDPSGFGYDRVLNPHRRPFVTKDGYLCCMPYTDAHWTRLWTARGQAKIPCDPRFRDIGARTQNIVALYELLQEELRKETTSYWMSFAEKHEIPVGPVLKLEELEHDAHLKAIGFFEGLNHPTEGRLTMPGIPVRFDGKRPPIGMPPTLGQHDAEILGRMKSS